MFGFVAAAGIKFTPCIKAGSFWAEHDKILVLITKSALIIGWVVCLAPSYDFQIYCVCIFFVFEDPNMFTKSGVVCIIVATIS